MNNKAQKKMAELISQYRKNLPEKIYHIELLWNEVQHDWHLNRFHDFYREIHSLCGSSGTYGYPDLSHAARQLELLLKNLLNKNKPSLQDQETITLYLNRLKTMPGHDSPEQVPLLEMDSLEFTENKYIYIMEKDQILSKQLTENLCQMNYTVKHILDLSMLQTAVKEQVPAAIIMNTHYLDQTSIPLILALQKQQENPIQLFCIVPNGELLPRLAAIRAGCHAFFQQPVDLTHLTHILNYKSRRDPYRILIIEDTASLAEYYALILNQAGMTTRAITNPLNLLKELESFQPNLLLMDVYMPYCTGFELAAVLRQENNYTKIPIIFLSTEDDKDKKLFAISLGGDDFLTKPISPQHLISAVIARSNRASILNYYMTTDSLTGLLNHSSILKQLNIQLTWVKRFHAMSSIVMIDIDYFKKINDTYGHPVGDMVIKKLASLLLTRLRSQDKVGRYGGEEFMLVLPGTALEDATKIVNELRVQFSQYCFNNNDKEGFYVTFSAGISFFNTQCDAQTIIKQADQALYNAKELGRNRVVAHE
jgi:diguanylate cyclase (GGDEF)-like protein